MRKWFAGVLFIGAAAFAGDAPPEPEDVVKTLVAFTDAHPDDLDARARLGQACLAVHDVQAAERAFLAVLEKSPNHVGALFGRGCAARDRGWWPDAAKFFRKYVEASPPGDGSRGWAELVYALTRARDADGAAKAVERALALPPERLDGGLFAVAAESAADRGDLKRAMEIAEAGCARFPSSPWAWSEEALLLDLQARDKEAAAALKKIPSTAGAGTRAAQRAQLALPVKARCRVVRAPYGRARPALPYRFECEFEPLDEHGKAAPAKAERNEEFVGWGAGVVAAADGIVIDVRNDVPDHDPGAAESARAAGNFVYVEHAPGEISRYFHLQKGSVVAKIGDRVRRGEPLGSIGNSGCSAKPVLGFALVRERAPCDDSRPFVFAKYVRIRKGEPIAVADGCPEADQWVEPGE